MGEKGKRKCNENSREAVAIIQGRNKGGFKEDHNTERREKWMDLIFKKERERGRIFRVW